jgi:nucleoside-diphosphate-sugar epimerase
MPLLKLVFASSSSVYGNAISYPVSETALPRPISPYGVTKLAAEHLCRAYAAEYSVPVATLRLFTVYGPRQRPDMAFSRLVTCALTGDTFELRGSGEQVRDCTFVGDVVVAMRSAAESAFTGVANVGGGSPVSMNEVIDAIGEICGSLSVERHDHAPGDVHHTEADTRVARAGFGYVASTGLRAGLEAMIEYERAELMRA